MKKNSSLKPHLHYEDALFFRLVMIFFYFFFIVVVVWMSEQNEAAAAAPGKWHSTYYSWSSCMRTIPPFLFSQSLLSAWQVQTLPPCECFWRQKLRFVVRWEDKHGYARAVSRSHVFLNVWSGKFDSAKQELNQSGCENVTFLIRVHHWAGVPA